MLRGGSWADGAGKCRAPSRAFDSFLARRASTGFRIVESNIKAPYDETSVSEQVSQKWRRIVQRFIAASSGYHLLALTDIPRQVLEQATKPRVDPKGDPALDLQQADMLDIAISEGDADSRSSEGYEPGSDDEAVAIVVRSYKNRRLYSVVFFEGKGKRGVAPPYWVVKDSGRFIGNAYVSYRTVFITYDRLPSGKAGGQEDYFLPGEQVCSNDEIRVFSAPNPASRVIRVLKGEVKLLSILSAVPVSIRGVQWYRAEVLRFRDGFSRKTGIVGFVSGAGLRTCDDI